MKSSFLVWQGIVGVKFMTAVDCALSSEVIVIGEDTDLLVLLIHHVNQQCRWVIFKSDKMAINKKNENMEHYKKFCIINCILISYVMLIELFTKHIYKRLFVMTV
jgi:hypothetical protein